MAVVTRRKTTTKNGDEYAPEAHEVNRQLKRIQPAAGV